jgi:hypothetical protein
MLLTSMSRTSIVKKFLIINEFSKRKSKKNTINIVHESFLFALYIVRKIDTTC